MFRVYLAITLLLAFTPMTALSKPNILIVITDDQGYGDLSVHGNPILSTPRLDAFAKQGVQLRNFYVNPVCAPTRSALMTGRYHLRTGVVDTYIGRAMMFNDELTVAEHLRGAGYRTGIFGKWHLGDTYPMRPQDQGFQESVIHLSGGIGQPGEPPGNLYTDPTLHHNGKLEKYNGYCTDIFTNEAIRFMQKGDQPFFAYVAFNCPHGPYQVPDQWVKPFLDRDLSPDAFPKTGFPVRNWNRDEVSKVYGMVANIDHNFGRMMDHLEKSGLRKDTIVLFLTDNGPGGVRFNAGLRQAKGTVYDGGIRVPAFLQYPARLPNPRAIETPVAHIDVLPTLAEWCDVPKPANIHWDGVSLVPLLEQESPKWPERSLFLQWHRGDVPEMGRSCAVRGPRYKLVQARGAGEGKAPPPQWELFDLSQDPFEQTDLAAQHPDIVERMKKEHERWFEDMRKTRQFAMPRIIVGNPAQNPVLLSRQDWRGPNAGWTPQSIGYWDVTVDRPGSYRITTVFSPNAKINKLELNIGNDKIVEMLSEQQGEVRSVIRRLTKGDNRIEPRLLGEGIVRGVNHVTVEWIGDDGTKER